MGDNGTPAPKLTPKQEAFARAYIETSNASEAYRRAYNAENMKPEVIRVKACELLASGNVAVRVDMLRAELNARHEITVDRIRDMLLEDRDFARDLQAASAAITATTNLAKLYGMMAEKRLLGNDPDNPLPPGYQVIFGRDG